MSQIFINEARSTIVTLLSAGCSIADTVSSDLSVHEAENRIRMATGYLEAANSLIARFPILWNELNEHPKFIELRAMRAPFRV